jgi:subtilisin-like proprotein convertase family protein
MKRNLFTLIVFSICLIGFSQTEEDVINITKNYNVALIKNKATEFKNAAQRERARAYDYALKNNIPMSYTDVNGNFHQLIRLTSDGYPLYYSTANQAAARSTRANHLNTGGSLGLTLNGQGMVARVWDGGNVRTPHNHFAGRVVSIDDPTSTTYNFHATHVMGTVLADGAATIRGMAYQATGRSFEWTDDESEVLSEVLGGMLISNHSYGIPVTGTTGVTLPAWFIGTYDQDARNWDEIAYLSPYYLMVASAGNDGQNENNADAIAFGYDKLNGNKTAKNNLVVANANDANIDASGNLVSVTINTSSSQGPTDDRRIKPDITGNGTNLLSTGSNNNTATTTLTGTSMASPNVAGTLLLLQQHYKNITTNFMKAATLKGLACHTADDAGVLGPDAIFGWGLLNAKAAAQAITSNGLTSWISEESLNQSQTFTMNVKSLGTLPLKVTACWTDVPGDPNNGQRPANDLKRALVNDLDVRITRNATTYYPWKLDSDPSSDAIRTSDNNIDNVEQVKIDAPAAGDYTITITHKGTLVNNKQDFSLIITGITSGFSLVSTSNDLEVCANQNAVYTFNYTQTAPTTTTFAASGLPSGATAVFSPTSRNSNGPVTMTISNLASVAPGSYNVGIIGNNGTESETRLKGLKIYGTTFTPVTLTNPTNGQIAVATTVNLMWNAQANAENYRLQVSTSPSFTTTVLDTSLSTNSYIISNLSQQTNYYWRVSPSNRCATDALSNATTNSFQTGLLSCGNEFSATDFSNASIASTANATASVPIVVTGGLTIGDINIALNISHTYIQDFTVTLTGPASIGSPVIMLLNQPCGDNDNLNCVMDDDGNAPVCATGANPALIGNVAPAETLTSLNGLNADGTWILTVDDPFNGDGGTINSAKIIVCNITPPLSIEENVLAGLKIYPNPSTGIVNIDLGTTILDDKSIVKLYDVQGRMISTKEMNNSIDQINISNLSNGVYMISIENGTAKTTKKIVLNR